MTQRGDWRADLHTHTVASDGRWSAEQLVEQVAAAGIDLFAVTDHDSLGSVARAAELAQARGLAFLPGVEISTKLNGRLVHLLAYGFDPLDAPFCDFVRSNEALLHAYDDELVGQLAGANYRVDLDEYASYTWDRHRGGWKSLNYLIDCDLCRDVHSFFNELFVGELTVTFPAFPHPADVIPLVLAAGGVPVWAHPAVSLSKRTGRPEEDEGVVAQLVAAGVQGLECYTCHHDPDWTARCLAWAERYGLLVTGGSDSHGGFAGRQLGQPPVHLRDLRLGPLADRIAW